MIAELAIARWDKTTTIGVRIAQVHGPICGLIDVVGQIAERIESLIEGHTLPITILDLGSPLPSGEGHSRIIPVGSGIPDLSTG